MYQSRPVCTKKRAPKWSPVQNYPNDLPPRYPSKCDRNNNCCCVHVPSRCNAHTRTTGAMRTPKQRSRTVTYNTNLFREYKFLQPGSQTTWFGCAHVLLSADLTCQISKSKCTDTEDLGNARAPHPRVLRSVFLFPNSDH
jgi:hypothetical protein